MRLSKMKYKWFAIPMLAAVAGVAGTSTPSAYAAAPQIAVSVQGQWDAPPAEFRDIQRQGFHDGIEGARKDFDHHRAPNVRNRDEYRHPHVDHAVREDYREGFRRGYEMAMHHMMDHTQQ
jgi:hypothetical protein